MPSAQSIHGVSILDAVLMILSRARLLRRGLALAWHALDHFFLPQFETLCIPGRRPVAVLSHPLDDSIPFRPREVKTYLGYISFLLKTQRFLYDRLGDQALPEIRRAFDELCLLYREAGSIYRRCQSTTTTREALPSCPYFTVIYLLDPHLHCIPSLHILLICYNSYRTAEVLRRRVAIRPQDERILAEVEAEAARVTEAILLVKQHSIIDIAPSLFLLSALFKGYGRERVEGFIARLFSGWPMGERVKAMLRSFIQVSYESLWKEHIANGKKGHRELILSFLDRFTPGVLRRNKGKLSSPIRA